MFILMSCHSFYRITRASPAFPFLKFSYRFCFFTSQRFLWRKKTEQFTKLLTLHFYKVSWNTQATRKIRWITKPPNSSQKCHNFATIYTNCVCDASLNKSQPTDTLKTHYFSKKGENFLWDSLSLAVNYIVALLAKLSEKICVSSRCIFV